jgi:hypothetical protein
MDWNDVQDQLLDLPRTFKRDGPTYQSLVNSITASLMRYTGAVDGTMGQLIFTQAVAKWLDTWGRLFNIMRNDGESDPAYFNRIQFLLVAGRGTPVAMDQYIADVEGVSASVVESLPATGYSIQFRSILTLAGYLQFAENLVNVRPVGVPFLPFMIVRGGLYLGTVNYLGRPKVTGAYFSTGSAGYSPPISATTNNATPLLPTYFLTDPTINPSLAG